MTQDSLIHARELCREQRRSPFAWIVTALFFAAVFPIYYMEATNMSSDLYIHANIASEFNFLDLHSITSRIAYPLWHVFVSAIYQIGVPIAISAAFVTAAFKAVFFVTAQCLILPKRGESGRAASWALCLLLMIITAVWIPSINPLVYRGVSSSPTVWHNPTQITVTACAQLCVVYLMHCFSEYERRLQSGEKGITISWKSVITLAVLLGLCAAAKPTLLQALIPAAFVLFLVAWIRKPAQWRYFVRIIIAFLPATAYFLLQYLYYTGVVVEFTSGVEFSLTAQSLWVAVRSALMLCAFPFAALLCGARRGKPADRTVILLLLMMLFSIFEAASFRETGMRTNHGNFGWAMGSSSILLWWIALRDFLPNMHALKAEGARGAAGKARACGFAVCWALLAWHLCSAVYYIYFLVSTDNVF